MTDQTDDDGRQIKCPFCPKCGSAPPFIFEMMYQAFCPNEECDVLMWVPWDTAAANLADMHEAVFTETPMETPPTEQTP